MSGTLRNLALVAVTLCVGVAAGWYFARPEDAATIARAPGATAAAASRPVSVVAQDVRYVSFANEVEALGTARANESVTVTVEVANIVTAIHFEEGAHVHKGDILVELDDAEARAELAVAAAALKGSRGQFKRSRELYATRALSEAQLEQLESTMLGNEAALAAAQARLEDTVIRAPFAGRVGLRRVSVGSLVSPGDTITTLDDDSVIKLDFNVPEAFLASVRPGMEVRARSPAWPDDLFKGSVASIDTRVDPVSRSVTVRARIDNRDRRLKPGMFMTVHLVRAEGRALVLPEQAIVPENDQHYVFRVVDGHAAKTSVETGRRRPGEVEVVSGLAEGDTVVIEGMIKLRDGVPVSVRTPAVASTAEQ